MRCLHGERKDEAAPSASAPRPGNDETRLGLATVARPPATGQDPTHARATSTTTRRCWFSHNAAVRREFTGPFPTSPAASALSRATADRCNTSRSRSRRRRAGQGPRHAAGPGVEALSRVAARARARALRARVFPAEGARVVPGELRTVGPRVSGPRADRRARHHAGVARPERPHAPARVGRPAVAPRW
jgi:hypothetical protein